MPAAPCPALLCFSSPPAALVPFISAVSSTPPANPAVQQLVTELLPQLLGGAASVAAYAAAYSSQHSSGSSSLRHRAAAAEMAALLDPASKQQGVQALLSSLQPDAAAAADLAACTEVHKLLLSGPLADAAAAAEWKQRCAKVFTRSNYFGGEQSSDTKQLLEQLADRIGAVKL